MYGGWSTEEEKEKEMNAQIALITGIVVGLITYGLIKRLLEPILDKAINWLLILLGAEQIPKRHASQIRKILDEWDKKKK